MSPTCLPFVSHILDALTLCLPFVSHILDALTPVWDPWFYTSYSFVSHLSPICLPHSGCSNARLGPLVLRVILICLPFVSHILDALTLVWNPWFYTSYSLVPACFPLVSHILDALTLVWDPWFYTSYSLLICSRLSPICLPHSGCSNARLGPLVLLVILIWLPLASHPGCFNARRPMDSNIVSHAFILVSLCEMNKQTLLAVTSFDLSSVDRFVSRGARVHEAKHSLNK